MSDLILFFAIFAIIRLFADYTNLRRDAKILRDRVNRYEVRLDKLDDGGDLD